MKGFIDSIQINTGLIKLPIIRDGENVGEIVFNPNDALLAEKFYQVAERLEVGGKELEKRAAEIDARTKAQDNGLVSNRQEIIDFLRETHTYMCEQYDYLFGEGTSNKVFGDFVPITEFGLAVHDQFVNGFKPYFAKTRSEKIAKYTTAASAKRNKRKRK